MTAPLDPGAQSGAGDTGQSAGAGADTSNGAAGTQSGANGQQGQADAQSGAPATPTPVHTAEEMAAQQARTRASDLRAGQLEQQLREIRDKDLPEMDKLKRDAEEYKAKLAQADQDLRRERVRNGFLSDNTYDWQDPAVALGMVDISKLEIDDQGQVVGLKAIIEGLAKQYPWMLKPKSEGDGGQQQTGVPPMNQGKAGQSGKPDKSEMSKRLPALRSRLGG
jgi:hypothetical protein